jgi:hypothetical protein
MSSVSGVSNAATSSYPVAQTTSARPAAPAPKPAPVQASTDGDGDGDGDSGDGLDLTA